MEGFHRGQVVGLGPVVGSWFCRTYMGPKFVVSSWTSLVVLAIVISLVALPVREARTSLIMWILPMTKSLLIGAWFVFRVMTFSLLDLPISLSVLWLPGETVSWHRMKERYLG